MFLAVALEPGDPLGTFGVADHVRAVQDEHAEFVTDPLGDLGVGGGQGDANVANLNHSVHRAELLAEELLRAGDVAGVPLHEANLGGRGWEGAETGSRQGGRARAAVVRRARSNDGSRRPGTAAAVLGTRKSARARSRETRGGEGRGRRERRGRVARCCARRLGRSASASSAASSSDVSDAALHRNARARLDEGGATTRPAVEGNDAPWSRRASRSRTDGGAGSALRFAFPFRAVRRCRAGVDASAAEAA